MDRVSCGVFRQGGSLITSPGVFHLLIYTDHMCSWKRTGKGKCRMARMSRRGIPVLKGGISDTKEERENGSGHIYKNTTMQKCKIQKCKRGGDRKWAQPKHNKNNLAKIQNTKTQRKERKCELAELQTLPITLCQLLFCLGDVSTL